MKDIKLLVACHREDSYVPECNLLVPVQVGAACAEKRFANMRHDDEGENISDKNPSYCELTALYWAWKNLDADYYGLFHYRRYFVFSEKHFKTNAFADVLLEDNEDKTLQQIGIDEKTMRSYIERYDLIVPERGHFVNGATIREQYDLAWEQDIEDLECVVQILDEKYPEMSKLAKEYLDGTEGYFCNMFIMRKELFSSYCAWLFEILDEYEQRRDYSMYDPTSYRVCGYLAERLTGIYLTWLIKSNKWTYRELQRTLFADVEKPLLLKPVFTDAEQEPVVLVLSANDFYVPYMGVLLHSIKKASSSDRFYDIIVLHSNISNRNQEVLSRFMASENISIRFFKTTKWMKSYSDKLFLRGHFKIETYFRLLMQDVLPEYNKALYLDCDMVVNRDIADLFDEDINGYLLAACKDADTAGLYNGAQPDKKEYQDNILRIDNPYEYFQAGTILFNLAEFRRRFTVEELFEFAMAYEWQLLDQDVLNFFAQGSTKFVDMSWNVMMDFDDKRIREYIGRAPRPLVLEYMEARKHPYIVHFAGPQKPWNAFASDYADYFWSYAMETPFAPQIIQRAMKKQAAVEADKRIKKNSAAADKRTREIIKENRAGARIKRGTKRVIAPKKKSKE